MFEPREFFHLAQELARQGDREAATRTAVSRAYYGAFLQAEIWLQTQGVAFSRTGRDHQIAVRELRKISRFAGDALQSLRLSRNAADYDLQAAVLDQDARLALLMASIIMQRTDLGPP